MVQLTCTRVGILEDRKEITMKYLNQEKLTQVRDQFYRVFEELKGRDRIEIVDASRSIEEIHQEIVGLLQ